MSPPDDMVVRDLRPDDVATAIDLLADAFLDFPALQVIVGTDAGARERMRRLFALEFEPERTASAIVAESDTRVVGALTFVDSPACSASSTGRMLRFARIAGPRLVRTVRLFGRIERAHPTTPHRHLPTLGVLPALQGRGIGGALMREFHHRCDTDGMASYLETIRWTDDARPSHERFYARLGYGVSTVIAMADAWSVLTMMRPARRERR
jgi:ribosomal protein S18 acetylase RimI-like enzyme